MTVILIDIPDTSGSSNLELHNRRQKPDVKLHGPRAALDHPGLAVLRSAPPAPAGVIDDHSVRGHAAGELPPGPERLNF
jgi:hypothetical protein